MEEGLIKGHLRGVCRLKGMQQGLGSPQSWPPRGVISTPARPGAREGADADSKEKAWGRGGREGQGGGGSRGAQPVLTERSCHHCQLPPRGEHMEAEGPRLPDFPAHPAPSPPRVSPHRPNPNQREDGPLTQSTVASSGDREQVDKGGQGTRMGWQELSGIPSLTQEVSVDRTLGC